jgi:polar amino acid transport system substrate-binding protein
LLLPVPLLPRRWLRRPNACRPLAKQAAWAPLLAAAAALALPLAASAETVLERASRSGEIVMVGPTDSPPLTSLDAKGQPVGYAIEVGKRIEAELAAQLGSNVRIRFQPVANTAEMVKAVASGGVDLACGVPFTWEREMVVDFSMPIGLSGVRLLTSSGAIDGTPASLLGRRVATVQGSLGATALKVLQPAAKEVSFPSLEAAFKALRQGKVEGLIGDSNVLAGLRRSANLSASRLVPDEPFVIYGVGCIVPENNSSFTNIVNLSIARLMAGYLEARPDAVASVDPWVGPNGVLGVPAERVRAFFQALLLSREGFRIQPPAAAVGTP